MIFQVLSVPKICIYNQFTHPKTGKLLNLEYDVSPLTDPEQGYHFIRDYNDMYYYSFSFCSNIAHPWLNCMELPGYPAYRHHNFGCNPLGVSHEQHQIGFVDVLDFASGFTLKYQANISYYGCEKMPSFTLQLFCTNYETLLPTDDQEIYQLEGDACGHYLQLESIFFCPVGCGSTSNVLCNGKGKCHYDDDDKSSHCYCVTGYYGYGCELQGQEGDEKENTNTLSYVFIGTSVFLAVILVLLIALWFSIIKIRLDPKSYNVMNVGLTKYQAL